MEGIQPKPQVRKRRVRARPDQAPGSAAVRGRDDVRTPESKKEESTQPHVKNDPGALYEPVLCVEVSAPSLQGIKAEPTEDPVQHSVYDSVPSFLSGDINAVESQPVSEEGSQIATSCSEQTDSGSILGAYGRLQPSFIVKHESTVKAESNWSEESSHVPNYDTYIKAS